MSTIYAITTIYGHGLDLLPHWLDHYTRLGVHRILVAVGCTAAHDFRAGSAPQDNIIPHAIRIARDYPAEVFPFQFDEYHTMYTEAIRQRVRRFVGIEPDDWIVHADLDEFYEFPAPLADIIAEMERYNDWALHGRILDRVAADGSLPAIAPTPSIGEQFPIGCRLTWFFGANTRKIMLCRGRVRVNAPHDNTRNAHFSRCPVGEQYQYIAHHFRWTDQLIPKLEARAAGQGVGRPYRSEVRRFLAYWQQHGRIDLVAPTLQAQHYGALQYPSARGE